MEGFKITNRATPFIKGGDEIPLEELYPCLKEYGIEHKVITDELTDSLLEDEYYEIYLESLEDLRMLANDINDSTFDSGLRKKLLIDFEENEITIIDSMDPYIAY